MSTVFSTEALIDDAVQKSNLISNRSLVITLKGKLLNAELCAYKESSILTNSGTSLCSETLMAFPIMFEYLVFKNLLSYSFLIVFFPCCILIFQHIEANVPLMLDVLRWMKMYRVE